MSFTASALIVSWAAIALLGFALAGVLQRVYALEQALRGDDGDVQANGLVGQPAPAIDGVDLAGGAALLVFADTTCGSCMRSLPEVERLAATYEGVLSVRMLWVDRPPDPLPVERVEHVPEAAPAFTAYGVPATPYAVSIDAEQRIAAAGVAGSPKHLERIAAVVAREREPLT